MGMRTPLLVHSSSLGMLPTALCPAQAYAFAVLGYQPGERLLSAVAKGVQWQLRDFSPQARSTQGLLPASCSMLDTNNSP